MCAFLHLDLLQRKYGQQHWEVIKDLNYILRMFVQHFPQKFIIVLEQGQLEVVENLDETEFGRVLGLKCPE